MRKKIKPHKRKEKVNEESMEWRLEQIEKQIDANSKEHMVFYEYYHKLDKDMALIAIKVGSITGAAASVVTWMITFAFQYFMGFPK